MAAMATTMLILIIFVLSIVTIYVYYSVVLSDNILHYFVKKNKNILTNAKEENPNPV